MTTNVQHIVCSHEKKSVDTGLDIESGAVHGAASAMTLDKNSEISDVSRHHQQNNNNRVSLSRNKVKVCLWVVAFVFAMTIIVSISYRSGVAIGAAVGRASETETSKWSLRPLLHGHMPKEVIMTLFDHDLFRFVMMVPLFLALVYPITHKLLRTMSARYNAIKIGKKQIIVAHHAVQAIILTTVLPFFTYYMVRYNFLEVSSLEDAVSNIKGIVKCAIVVLMIYMFELASRFEEPRLLVVFHHVLAYSDMMLACLFPTSVMLKSAFLLGYFIVFEAPTFMGLFMYRIFPNSALTPNVIFTGMIVFGITRPLQVLWVGAAIFGSWNDENVVKWQGAMQMVVTLILTGIQLFTLKIHYGMWKRSVAKQKKTEPKMDSAKTEKTAAIGFHEEEEVIKNTTDLFKPKELFVTPTLTL